MISYIHRAIFVTCLSLQPFFAASAIDFDGDNFADFISIEIDQNQDLNWYALDINDSARRYLGKFGTVGNHIALGRWSGGNSSSKALIKKNSSGSFEWNIELNSGVRKLNFGQYPAQVVAGLDMDNNGAIDPAVVSVQNTSLVWQVIQNPALDQSAQAREVSFGTKSKIPFFANIDSQGDQLAIASYNKSRVLSVRYKNLSTGKVKSQSIRNLTTNPSAILPVEMDNGKDALFLINKQGKSIEITIVNGNKKVKTIRTTGEEIVVGKYLGHTRDILVVKRGPNKALFIDAMGNTKSFKLDLSGILVDEININSFSDSDETPTPETPSPRAPNPRCAGVADSREHLLYKPVSDTSGNAVVVFDSKYSQEFAAVKIELKDGTFAEGWWKGLALWGNPDVGGPRQHWRTNVRSSQIKDNALIIATDSDQECRFTIPGSGLKRWE
jgi:hypothetical protein